MALIGPGMIIGRSVHEIIVITPVAFALLLVLASLQRRHLGSTLGLLLGLTSPFLLLFGLAASLFILFELGDGKRSVQKIL